MGNTSELIKSEMGGKFYPQLQVLRAGTIIYYANLGTWAEFSIAGVQQDYQLYGPQQKPLDLSYSRWQALGFDLIILDPDGFILAGGALAATISLTQGWPQNPQNNVSGVNAKLKDIPIMRQGAVNPKPLALPGYVWELNPGGQDIYIEDAVLTLDASRSSVVGIEARLVEPVGITAGIQAHPGGQAVSMNLTRKNATVFRGFPGGELTLQIRLFTT